MKKLTSLAGASLVGASLLFSAGVLAADLPVKAPPRSIWVDSWAGPYIGVYFGAGAGRATESSTGADSFSQSIAVNNVVLANQLSSTTSAGNLAGDMTGSMVDLFAGYNWRVGNFVVGGQVEGTVFSDVALKPIGTQTFNTINRDLLAGTVVSTSSGTFTGESNQQLRSRVGLIGRAGFLARPDVLLYGLGGLELGHFVFPDNDGAFGGKNGKWVAGYTIGAGGEVKLTDNWSLRGEYRYLHFGINRDATSVNTQTTVQGIATNLFTQSQASTQHINADFHVGKIGLVYQFGDARPLSAMAAMPPAPGTAWGDSWAGPYVGAYFGAGAGRARETFTRADSNGQTTTVNNVVTQISASTESTAGNLAGDMTGSMVDLFAGYNWRTGNFVVGGQLEGTLFSDVTLKPVGTSTFTSVQTLNGAVTSTTSGTFTIENGQQLRSNVGAIGRAGYLVTPNLLLYGLGGLALGHFTYPDGDDRFGGKNGKWVAGYTVGAGGEVKLSDNWSLRGEYRYLHFGFNRNENDSSASTSASGATTTGFTNASATARHIDADFHLGKVGLVYRFGEAGSRSAMAAMPSAPVWSDGWAGPYIGAYFGAGAGSARETVSGAASNSQRSTTNNVTNTSADANLSTGRFAGDMTGSMVDLFAGYNWRTGNVVVGGQLEGTLFSDVALKSTGNQTNTSVRTTNGIVTTTSAGAGTNENQQQLRSNVGAIGRVGYLVTPNVLLYGLGGLALGHFTYPDDDDRFGGKNGKWVAGYTVGGGGEVKLSDNWSLRGEYRYLHFGFNRSETQGSSQTSVIGATTNVSADGFNAARQINADFHVGKIGLVRRFGEPGPLTAMAAMSRARSDSWAGPYVGAYFAAGAGRATESFASGQDTVQTSTTNNVTQTTLTSVPRGGNLAGDMTGSMVDLFAGYNWRTGNVVVGGQIEGTVFSDVAFKTIGNESGSFTQIVNGVLNNAGTFTGTVQTNEQLRSNVGAIGRLGYLVTPKLLLYGLGGLALGHFVHPDGDDRFGGPNGKWVAGYTAGAGGELKLTDRWSLRGEYRYLHFDVNRTYASSNSGTAVSGATTDTFSFTNTAAQRTGVDLHLGKLGAVYSFCYCD